MKIVIPVAEYRGLESQVHGHFGSAPAFAFVDTDTMTVVSLANNDHDHIHGRCNPVKALMGKKPDAVIVGGIGSGALHGLRSAGIKVYCFGGGIVAEAVCQFKSGALSEMDATASCIGHVCGSR